MQCMQLAGVPEHRVSFPLVDGVAAPETGRRCFIPMAGVWRMQGGDDRWAGRMAQPSERSWEP
jgi:hypothetical protein